jgi:hypothetical protein
VGGAIVSPGISSRRQSPAAVPHAPRLNRDTGLLAPQPEPLKASSDFSCCARSAQEELYVATDSLFHTRHDADPAALDGATVAVLGYGNLGRSMA